MTTDLDGIADDQEAVAADVALTDADLEGSIRFSIAVA